MPTYETVEAAQARILELEQELVERTNERDTLSENNNQLSARVEELRTLNQKYFNQLSAQFVPADPEPDEPEPVPCEDFAKTINI